jgi:hemoglobin
MHWLEEELQNLAETARQSSAPSKTYLTAVRNLVHALAENDAVTAAFACHDGLAFEVAGRTPDFEALSAMAQLSAVTAKETALTLSLGRPQQLVLIGVDHKLALFLAGPLAVGVLARSNVNLGQALEKGPHPQKEEGAPMARTLLSDLGGRPAVEAVVALFYAHVLGDQDLAPFFRGASMPRLQTLQTEFFCAVLDGKPWRGRDLKTVHAGLPITDWHFDRVALHLEAALREAGAPQPKIDEVIALVETVRPHIVNTLQPRHADAAGRGDDHERAQLPAPARRNS